MRENVGCLSCAAYASASCISFGIDVKKRKRNRQPLRNLDTTASASWISFATDQEKPQSLRAFSKVSTSASFCMSGQSLGPPSSAPSQERQLSISLQTPVKASHSPGKAMRR